MAWIRVHGLLGKKKTLNAYIIEPAEICNMDIIAINNKDFCHKLLERKDSQSKTPTRRRLLK